MRRVSACHGVALGAFNCIVPFVGLPPKHSEKKHALHVHF